MATLAFSKQLAVIVKSEVILLGVKLKLVILSIHSLKIVLISCIVQETEQVKKSIICKTGPGTTGLRVHPKHHNHDGANHLMISAGPCALAEQ
jgi:hypothetical protein